MQFVLLYLLYIFLLLLFCEEAQANAGFNDNTSRNEVSLRIRRALRQNGDIYMSRSFAGCPYGWTAGDGGCYYMPLQKVTSRDTAMQKCLKLGAHLVTVESEKENAFLSLKFKYIRDPILTGGIKTSQWAWEKISDRQQNSRINYGHIIQVPITHFFNWFPGWRGGIKYDDPSDGIDENCIYLRSRYIHPVYEVEANLDIFYWSDDVCQSTKTRLEGGFRYLCEKPKKISKGARVKKFDVTGVFCDILALLLEDYDWCYNRAESSFLTDVVRCADSQFTCGSGLCLLASSVCDGVCHCYPDCEDERKYGPLTCNSAIISLVNGTASEGRLEVTINGQRGVVCDDSFDDNAAKIYCNVLDFKYGQAITGGAFGEGSAPIVLDNIKCTGTESSTWKCRRSEFGTHDCDRSEIVGIKCSNEMLKETSAQPQCGNRPIKEYFKADIAQYIVGGIRPLRHGLFPWQASIRTRHQHVCGGTIIDKQWILTAAHCFNNVTEERRRSYWGSRRQYPVNNADFVIRTGDYDNTKRDRYEQEFNIAHIKIHESYDPEVGLDYDIALVKIKTDGSEGIDFNDHVQPACLPTTSKEYKQGHKCYISGWGAIYNETAKEYQYPTTLQIAEIPLQSEETCSSFYKNIFTARMVCAGDLTNAVNTCYGDSGGPLVCMENNVYFVMGITSFGPEECDTRPSVYAKVSRFIIWIKNNLSEYS